MAKITKFVKKTIGKNVHQFTVEGENLHEVVMQTKNFSFGDVHKCGLCGSDDLDLSAHVAKNKFKYTLVKCNSCKGYLNFGTQTENPNIFYLRTKEIKDPKTNKTSKVLDWKTKDTPMEEDQDPTK